MSTLSEAMNAVTGFDEIAVDKHFGLDLYAQAQIEGKPVLIQRAVVFVDLRHQGVADRDAYRRAMEMPVSELGGYFEPEPENELPDDPDSEPGKGA